MTHHKQGHPTKGCLHCDVTEQIMKHHFNGAEPEDIVMQAMEAIVMYVVGETDEYREELVRTVETGFREMVFGGAASEIRILIKHEGGARH